MGFSARGRCSNGRGRDNARAEGECIICSRLLLHCPSAPTKPVMHTKLVSKQFSATHLPETTVGIWKVCIIWIMHTKVCIKRFKTRSCGQLWGVWFVEGHVSSTNIIWYTPFSVQRALWCLQTAVPFTVLRTTVTSLCSSPALSSTQNTRVVWLASWTECIAVVFWSATSTPTNK